MKHLVIIFISLLIISCKTNKDMTKIAFLHHSTGSGIWVGKTNRYLYKITKKGDVQKYLSRYNSRNKTDYIITEQSFPKKTPYGWNNYPYDYYNIWVKNAGDKPYMEEPTLEMLTKEYDVIIFKHCFPATRIAEDTGRPDIDSETKSIENYKLQYDALKKKMHEFPETKFIVWTPAACVKSKITEEEAIRAQSFHAWVTKEWDEKGDNIFVWDFYKYETEGGLYLTDNNAISPDNCHPAKEFSGKVAPLFVKYIADVIEDRID